MWLNSLVVNGTSLAGHAATTRGTAPHHATEPRLRLSPADRFDAPNRTRDLRGAWPLHGGHAHGVDGLRR